MNIAFPAAWRDISYGPLTYPERVRTTTELSGFTVGVTADRRGKDQRLMFERLGAQVVWGPAITTLPVGGEGDLRRATERIIVDPPDFFVANTGLGVRNWFGLAEAWGIDEALRQALRSTRIAARGPKAAGAMGIAGLDVWWRAANEQLASVGDRLVSEGVVGKRVVVQLHGDDRQPLTERLGDAGAVVSELLIYRWTLPEDGGPSHRLIDLCCRGEIDAVTFTAGPAVRNLLELAEEIGKHDELLRALNGEVLVACVGPVCGSVANEEGIVDVVIPERWRLGSLVGVVSEVLGRRRRHILIGEHELVLQGAVVLVDGQPVRLTELERGVLTYLARQPGATFGRGELLREVWGDPDADPHVLEATVARLRSKLGSSGDAIETVVRRGYRMSSGASRIIVH